MKNSARLPAADDSSRYAVSAFTHELIDTVSQDNYRLRAWRILVSRSWTRSLHDIKNSPERMRSASCWIAIVATAGAAIVLIAFHLRTPDRALTALVFWLSWYVGAAFFLITHIHRPVPLRPTCIGRTTTFAARIILLVIALKTLLSMTWPTPQAIEWLVRVLYFIIGINLLSLFRSNLEWRELNDRE